MLRFLRNDEANSAVNSGTLVLRPAGGAGAPNDRQLAKKVLRASAELQTAIDTAVSAGLVVEPSVPPGAADHYTCAVKVYRELA